MTRHFLAIIILFGLISCNDQNITPNNIEGAYEGTFSVIHPDDQQSNVVTLEFDNGTFKGESTNPNHPALGTGAFRLKGSGITFTNASFWTANFDWNLILEGEFIIESNGNQLQLTKTINQTTYKYNLTKVE